MRAVAVAIAVVGAMGVAIVGPFGTGQSENAAKYVRVEAPVGAPLAAGDINNAIGTLQAGVAASPDDGRAWAQLGLAYLSKARTTADPALYPKAEFALEASLENGGGYQASLGMAILGAARHDFGTGLAWGRRAAGLNPDGADARGIIGDSLLEMGRYEAARRAFQTMVDLEPNAASFARVAYYREITGDATGAVEAMERALTFAGTPEDIAWVSHQIGELHFHAGRLGAARVAHRRAVSAVPGYVPSRAALAELVAAHGNFDRAAKLFRAVIAERPTPEYTGLLGDVYTRLGRIDAANDQYELAALLSDPSRTGEVGPDPATALLDASLGRPDALATARDIYASRPTVEAADALAWTLYTTGKYKAAARMSKFALHLGTESAQFHFHAGMIQLRLGHERTARAHLVTALDTHPNFSFVDALVARRTLERLGG
jgi:tetratricopeptide (TPR) repeat protein